MRFPSIPTIIRAFHTVSNTTSAFIRANPTSTLGRTFSIPQRTVYRSMPNIPFFGALFGSSSMADNTQYPVQKAEGEWQAQLSPGMSAYLHINTSNVDRAIPRPAQQGHRAPRLRNIRQALPDRGRLHLPGLRGTSIQGEPQV
jgi:hypothetical protein